MKVCLPIVFITVFWTNTFPAKAQAQGPNSLAPSCFEIIAPQRYTQLSSPILFDRCTGETWMLVRSHAGSPEQTRYRWVILERDSYPEALTDRRQSLHTSHSVIRPSKDKCFQISERRFCE
jgi:hypothetical protein